MPSVLPFLTAVMMALGDASLTEASILMSRADSRASRSPLLMSTRGQSSDLPRSAALSCVLEMESFVSQ